MRLAAIYNVWSDSELLQHSIGNIISLVDGVIVIFSRKSNSGEIDTCYDSAKYIGVVNNPHEIWTFLSVQWENLEPDLSLAPSVNERAKRNFGLQKARELGFTHFIMMDADEFYEPEPLLREKQRFIDNPDLLGLVCELKCYFKNSTLTVPDKTLVPFIHKITPDLKFEWNTKYPFAFEGVKREIRIDPTRMLNINSGVIWSDIIMHHYSWVRSDIQKKIRNSTARQNIENSTIVKDYLNAKAGYYCEFYKATIESCENLFNLPEIIDYGLISSQNREPSETTDNDNPS